MRSATHLGLAALLALSTVSFAQITQQPSSTPPSPPTPPGQSKPVPSGTTTTPADDKVAKDEASKKADSLPSPGEALDTEYRRARRGQLVLDRLGDPDR